MNLTDAELQCLREGSTAVLGHRLVRMWVVGSFARGEEVQSSDVDLMILASNGLSLADMGALGAWFDESDLVFVVDLVDYGQVAPQRLAALLRDGVEIFPA